MTRFDAAAPAERRKLFADAVQAHRTRGSAFLTVEADVEKTDAAEEAEEGEAAFAPWIQFSERTFNVDCTDTELERLKDLVGEFPEFRIDQLEAPEDAEGTNVRITARSDPNRLAEFVDRTFQAVYGLDPDYRAWVTQV